MTVWAPSAPRMRVLLDGSEHEMTRGDGGWWTVEAPDGTREYAFLIADGDTPVPDPRSL